MALVISKTLHLTCAFCVRILPGALQQEELWKDQARLRERAHSQGWRSIEADVWACPVCGELLPPFDLEPRSVCRAEEGDPSNGDPSTKEKD